MTKTKIEWSEEVWNPTTGCDRVSPGCDNCYALTLAKRLKGMGSAKYQNDGDPKTSGPGFGLSVHPSTLLDPLGWQKPRRVFVNSMSDLFHNDVPDAFIARVFAVMAKTKRHTFQILTKRHARMRSLLSAPWFPELVTTWAWRDGVRPLETDMVVLPAPNVWLGVSVENQQWADIRIPALLDTPAAVRFLSCEPLLGPVDLGEHIELFTCPTCQRSLPWTDGTVKRLGDERDEYWCQFCGMESPLDHCTRKGIDWVIVGGESGPGARPMHPGWARNLRDQCQAARVPFFMKQWGEWIGYANADSPWRDREPDAWVNAETGAVLTEDEALADGGSFHGVYRVGKHPAGRELDGRTWDEMPDRMAVSS